MPWKEAVLRSCYYSLNKTKSKICCGEIIWRQQDGNRICKWLFCELSILNTNVGVFCFVFHSWLYWTVICRTTVKHLTSFRPHPNPLRSEYDHHAPFVTWRNWDTEMRGFDKTRVIIVPSLPQTVPVFALLSWYKLFRVSPFIPTDCPLWMTHYVSRI